MNKEENAADMLQAYKSLTDPKKREEAKRNAERQKRIDDKKKDTGL